LTTDRFVRNWENINWRGGERRREGGRREEEGGGAGGRGKNIPSASLQFIFMLFAKTTLYSKK
jgi:hypothetical protein